MNCLLNSDLFPKNDTNLIKEFFKLKVTSKPIRLGKIFII